MRRKGDTSKIREADFKSTCKGKKKDKPKDTIYILDEEETIFVRKLHVGIGKFKGKIDFISFCFGILYHYATKCPHKENNGYKEKGKDVSKKNVKNKSSTNKIFYSNEDTSDDQVDSDSYSKTRNKILMALEEQLTSESDHCETNDLMNMFREIDRLKNANKYLETK